MIEIIAFSDWETQSFELFESVINGFREKPDLILYIGKIKQNNGIKTINWFERLADCSKSGLVTMNKYLGNNVFALDEMKEIQGIKLSSLGSKSFDYNSIIIAHRPPLGILDDKLFPGQQGCEKLRNVIDKKYPLLVITGQTIQGPGRSIKHKVTNVVNLSGYSDDKVIGTFAWIKIENRNVDIQWMDTKPDISDIPLVNRSDVNSILNAGILKIEQLISWNPTDLMTIQIEEGRLSKIMKLARQHIKYEKQRRSRLEYLDIKPIIQNTNNDIKSLEGLDNKLGISISKLPSVSFREKDRLILAGINTIEQLFSLEETEMDIPITEERIIQIKDQAKAYIEGEKYIKSQLEKLSEKQDPKNTNLSEIPHIRPGEIINFNNVGITYIEQLVVLLPYGIASVIQIKEERIRDLILQSHAFIRNIGIWKSTIRLPKKYISVNIEVTKGSMIWMISARFEDDLFLEYCSDWKKEKVLLSSFHTYLNKYPTIPIIYYDGEDRVYNYLWHRAKFNGNNDMITEMSHRMWIDLKRLFTRSYITPNGRLELQLIADLINYDIDLEQEFSLKWFKDNCEDHKFLTQIRLFHKTVLDFIPFIIDHFKEDIKFLENPEKVEYFSIFGLIIKLKIFINGFSLTCDFDEVDDLSIALMNRGLPLPEIDHKKEYSVLTWDNNVARERFVQIKKKLK